MDELRSFLAKRARESGDRQAFVNLEFEQATDHLTLEKYKAFEKVCKPEEWTRYEPLVLKHLDKAWESEKLKICMYRKDFEQALATLKKMGPPGRRYDGGYSLKVAQALEERFPKEILAYYRSGLGDLKVNRPRKEYADQGRIHGQGQTHVRRRPQVAPRLGSLRPSHKDRQCPATGISGGDGRTGAGLEGPRIGRFSRLIV